MLTTSEHSSIRRFSGAALVAVLGCGVAFAAWSSQPQATSSGSTPRQVAPTESAMPNIDAVQQGQALDESRALHPPRYPVDALKEGKTGMTVLMVDIDAHGSVTGLKVERSSGDARLDAAALETAVKWRFNPAMKQGRPVASKVRVPIQFAMDEPGTAAAQGGSPVALARHALGAAAAVNVRNGLDALLPRWNASWKRQVAREGDEC